MGLAYLAEVPVNWCPELKTVLANEEFINGKSERGGYPVIRIPMRQWMLKITAYADRLLEDLDLVDFPESIKEMQRNWIGRSEGADIDFKIEGSDQTIKVFTTRPDTLFGATYMVLAPEHPILKTLVPPEYKKTVEAYQQAAASKSDLDRTELAKEKTGVFTGLYAINPANNRRIPIWTSDYVLMSYGTGAIMAVPGHDQRDWEFAKKFGLEIVEVISGGDITKEAYVGDGILVNSGFLNGLNVAEAKRRIIEWLSEKGIGQSRVQYKLRDWVFSRQRYWGEPFPLYYDEDNNIHLIDESKLPLELPPLEKYEPSGTGESPQPICQNGLILSIRKPGNIVATILTQCHNGRVRAGIICVLSILTTMKHFATGKKKSYGCRLIYISVVPNTPFCICYTLVSGIKYYTIWDMSRRLSLL